MYNYKKIIHTAEKLFFAFKREHTVEFVHEHIVIFDGVVFLFAVDNAVGQDITVVFGIVDINGHNDVAVIGECEHCISIGIVFNVVFIQFFGSRFVQRRNVDAGAV